MEWLNPPPEWHEDGAQLKVTTGLETDFWSKTHYGFIHENGHFYFREVEGDFSATVKFTAEFAAQYDQAGLMLRVDGTHWIKAGIEFYEAAMHFSTVVTREFSDWDMQPWLGDAKVVWLRLTRKGDAVAVELSPDGLAFRSTRLTYLPPGGSVQVGPMCCSPTRAGLTVTFEDFAVGPPADFAA